MRLTGLRFACRPLRRTPLRSRPVRRRPLRRSAVLAPVLALGLVAASGTAASAAEDPPTVRELLDKCDNGTDACIFHVAGPAEIITKPMQEVGQTANCTPNTQKGSKVTWTNTDSWSNSLGFSWKVLAGPSKAFTMGYQITYNHKWTESVSESESVQMDIPAGSIGRVILQRRMEKVTGTYELRFPDRFRDHYFWYVDNVAVTMPVAANENEDITTRSDPMTAEERQQYCPGA